MTDFNNLTEEQLEAFEEEYGWYPEEEAEYICKIHLDQYADLIEETCKEFVALDLGMDLTLEYIWTDERMILTRRFYDIMNKQNDQDIRDKMWKEDVIATLEGMMELA